MAAPPGPSGDSQREQLLVRCRPAGVPGLPVPLADRAFGGRIAQTDARPRGRGLALFDAVGRPARHGQLSRRAAPALHPRDAARTGPERRPPRSEQLSGRSASRSSGWPSRAGACRRTRSNARDARKSMRQAEWQRICRAAEGLPGFEAWGAIHEDELAGRHADCTDRRYVVCALRAQPLQVSARACQ